MDWKIDKRRKDGRCYLHFLSPSNSNKIVTKGVFMIDLGNMRNRKKGRGDGDEKSKPVRLEWREIMILNQIKEERGFDTPAVALNYLFNKVEDEITEELKNSEAIFRDELLEISEKYLEKGTFEKKLVIDFLFILNHHEGNKEYLTNTISELRKELENE